MVASSARIGAIEFAKAYGPAVLLILVAFVGPAALVFRKRQQHVMEFDESRAITDRKLLKRYGVVVGAVLSVDNIPLVPTRNAVIHEMAVTLHPSSEGADSCAIAHAPDVWPLWWALSLGACLGGNSALVGASANVAMGGVSERAKHPIWSVRSVKHRIPTTLPGILVSAVHPWLRFLR